MGPKSLVDKMFQDPKEMEEPTPSLTCALRSKWMSDRLLRLIDARADHLFRPKNNRNMAHTLTKSVRKLLVVDIRRIPEFAAEDIGACL